MDNKQLFDIIKNNIKEYYYDNNTNPEKILSLLDENGKFIDIDYITQNWTSWGPFLHMMRLKELSAVFATEKNPYFHSMEIETAIHKGIKFYFDSAFHSDNWWMNDIGVPTACGMLRLMFKDYLTIEEDEKIAETAAGNPNSPRVFSIVSNPDKNALRPYISQGMHVISQLVDTHFQLVIDDGDAETSMKKIFDCIEAINIEMKVITFPASRSDTHLYSDEHCIKTDYSYHEHENEFVPNSYGYGMIEYFATLCAFWKGTDLRPDDIAIKEYINLILDGFDFSRYKCVPPMTTLGRDAANFEKRNYRKNNYDNDLITVCEALLNWNINYRTKEIENLLERTKNPENTSNILRTKYFWHSDFLSHNRKNYQFSVHAVSNRMKRPESILKKNVQGMLLGDGTYNIMVTGKEYDGIAPVMDWQKLPGTTATKGKVNLNPECEIDTKIDTLRIFGGAKGTTAFVGGVSDDKYGAFAYDYNHLNVKAKKSWFCFDECIVCLGAAINTDASEDMFTTVNQSLLFGKVKANGKEIEEGSRIVSKVKNIYADKIGYIFFEPTDNIYLSNRAETGNWKRVDIDSGTETAVSKKVFLLGINHSFNEKNAHYSYCIFPDISENDLNNYSQNIPVELIVNSEACQAVWHKDLKQLQAVFYKPGSIKTKDFAISVSQPCCILLSIKDDHYTIWASNPMHEECLLEIMLEGIVNNKLKFNFKEGYMKNNLGRPFAYDSKSGFLEEKNSQLENLRNEIYYREKH